MYTAQCSICYSWNLFEKEVSLIVCCVSSLLLKLFFHNIFISTSDCRFLFFRRFAPRYSYFFKKRIIVEDLRPSLFWWLKWNKQCSLGVGINNFPIIIFDIFPNTWASKMTLYDISHSISCSVFEAWKQALALRLISQLNSNQNFHFILITLITYFIPFLLAFFIFFLSCNVIFFCYTSLWCFPFTCIRHSRLTLLSPISNLFL